MGIDAKVYNRLAAGLLIDLVGGAAMGAIVVIYILTVDAGLLYGNPGTGQAAYLIDKLMGVAELVMPAYIAVIAVAAAFQFAGFSELARTNSKYSIARIGTVLQPVGSAMAFPGVIIILNVLRGALLTVNHGQPPLLSIQPTPGLSFLASVVPALALLGAAAVVELVGTVLVIIGYFRLGEESNSSIITVGAVLYLLFFVPYVGSLLSLVGMILLVIGLLSLRGRA